MIVAEKILIGLVGLLHIWFFVLERYIWRTELGSKIFKLTPEYAKAGEVLAANQGVYNLFLAVGLFWTLFVRNNNSISGVKIFILLFIIFVGFYGTVTVGRNILFMQVLPAVAALVVVIVVLGKPRINDITTSFLKVPSFVSIDDFTNNYNVSFVEDQKTYFKSIRPLHLAVEISIVFEKVKKIIKERNWNVVNVDQENFRFEGFEKTQFFNFRDDFVIELTKETSGEGTVVNMRSRSRKGRSDFGVNAKRINDFFENLSGDE